MPALADAPQKVCFQRGLAATVGKSGFSDVTIITGGTEALGHGIFVDEKSVESLMGLLMGKSLPGYLTHEGAMFGDRLGSEIGIFSGFYRDGLKLKAKAFRFLNSFVKNDVETYEKLIELAQELPEQFGLSVVFGGRLVWDMGDGEDVDADEPMPEGARRGIPSVRFSSVESADFVKAPAANPGGLFAKPDGECDLCTSPRQYRVANVVSGKLHEVRLCEKCATDRGLTGLLKCAPGVVGDEVLIDLSDLDKRMAAVDGATDGMSQTTSANSKTIILSSDEANKIIADIHGKLGASNEEIAAKKVEIDAFAAVRSELAQAQKDAAEFQSELGEIRPKLADALATISDRDNEITEIKAELETAKTFDMRKAGVRPDAAPASNQAVKQDEAPATFANDSARWKHYAKLKETDAAAADAFYASHLKLVRR